MPELKVTFDPGADAAYVYLAPIGAGDAVEQIVVEDAPGMVVLDLDKSRRLIGIEVIGAKQVLPEELLREATRL